MKARILVDNVTQSDLKPEWGLSVWIEYEGHSILLDTGASGLFAENAEAMGISISKAEFAVLSHAHYDHGDGLDCFFERNPAAKVYLQKGIQENCYSRNDGPFEKYIGLKKGLLSQYADRFCYVEGAFSPVPGVTLLSHTTPGLEKTGERAGMLRWENGGWRPDDFRHEQSLIFETASGLVIFNSCSHAGVDCIIKETAAAFPGKHIEALIGGFHLFRSTDGEVRSLAERIRETEIRRLYTGHCTGDRAMEILKEEFGDQIEQLYTGMEIEIP